MLFNSFEFALFLPVVFLLYWFVFNRNLRLQNIFVVACSYFFYGWWNWKFLLLIGFTSITSYVSGLLIEKYKDSQWHQLRLDKFYLWLNVGLNLIILGIFKYYNFFGENLSRLFNVFGFDLDWVTRDILLPVGISFYTFQALSYSIDVYKDKLKASRDIVGFFAYVSFFPQLVAGPIERATHLLPQFMKRREFDYNNAVVGMRQILWGLFKKIVVADNCAIAVNEVFGHYSDASGSTLLAGAFLFTFQIYGDFSGYSDIAIGTGRLFGIDLMQNFKFPYFSRDIAEFWRRWHISLTSWFRDYLYIPLGGSRGSKSQVLRNTFIIFIVSGFWHGANWTFIVWGIYHALLFVPLLLLGENRRYTRDIVASEKTFPSLSEFLKILLTFFLVMIGWIIFRASSIQEAWTYIVRIFDPSLFSLPVISYKKYAVFGIIILLIVEWFGRKNSFALERLPLRSSLFHWFVCIALVYLILYMYGPQANFIYFQF